MKTNYHVKCLMTVLAMMVAALAPSGVAFAQKVDSVTSSTRISEIDLQMLTSPNDGDRPMAFFRLRNQISDPRVATGIRKLLAIESAIQRTEEEKWEKTRTPSTRTVEGTYYRDIADAVADIVTPGDIRPLLVFIGQSQYAVDKIAALGPTIIDTLLNAFEDTSIAKVRMNAATIVKSIMVSHKGDQIPPHVKAKIRKRAMDAALHEKHNVTRLASVEILGEFKDEEIRGVLQRLMLKDEFSLPVKGGGRRYPIKEAASKALEKYK